MADEDIASACAIRAARRVVRGVSLVFEWDPWKAARNLNRHGVSFGEAIRAFSDPLSITVPDPDHSIGEERFLLMGIGSRGRLLVVSHSEVSDRIRLISARPANRRERRDYEERA